MCLYRSQNFVSVIILCYKSLKKWLVKLKIWNRYHENITQISFCLNQTLHINPSFLPSRLKYYTYTISGSGSGTENEKGRKRGRGGKGEGREKERGREKNGRKKRRERLPLPFPIRDFHKQKENWEKEEKEEKEEKNASNMSGYFCMLHCMVFLSVLISVHCDLTKIARDLHKGSREGEGKEREERGRVAKGRRRKKRSGRMLSLPLSLFFPRPHQQYLSRKYPSILTGE